MALEHIKTDGTENGETAANKINLGFSKTDLNKTVLDSQAIDINVLSASTLTNTNDIAANTNNIASNTTNIDTLLLNNPLISIASGTLTTQTLEEDTPEKLLWMTTATVDDKQSALDYDLDTSDMITLESGVYKVFGVVTITAPNNDEVNIELYIDNLPTGFISSVVGRGPDLKISAVSAFMNHFSINDEITLYVTSTGTEVTVQSASMTVEKTKY